MSGHHEYYGAFNLPSDASEAQIRSSYLRISRSVHPDKQLESNKKSAEKIFSRLQFYQKILLNPTTRFIYDTYGDNGIRLISNRKYISEYPLRTLHDKKVIKSKMDYLIEKSAESQVNAEVQHRSSLTLNLSLVDYLSRTKEFKKKQEWNQRSAETSLLLNEMVKLELTSRLAADLGFLVYTADGGCFTVLTPRLNCSLPSGYSLNLSFQVGDRFLTTLGASKTIGNTSISLQATASSSELAPVLSVSRYLTPESLLQMSLSGGSKPNCSFAYEYTHSKSTKFRYKISASDGNCEVSANITHELLNKFFLKLALGSSILNYNKKRLTIVTYPGFGLHVDLSRVYSISYLVEAGKFGLQVVVKCKRGAFEFKLPIAVASVAKARNFGIACAVVAAAATVTYGLSWVFGSFRGLFDKKKRKAEKSKEKLQDHEFYIASLKDLAKHIRKDEESVNGLLIIKARYGDLGNGIECSEKVIDVTDVLQEAVEKSRLFMPAGTKAESKGFFNPCEPKTPFMYIKYRFAGIVLERVYQDKDIVILP